MSYLKHLAGVIAAFCAMSSAYAITYESVADGNWSSPNTWKNGENPGDELASGDTIFIFHDVLYDLPADLTIRGYLMATTRPGDDVITFSVDSDAGRSIFVESGGEFSIHFANFKMPIYNGTKKGSGSLKASAGGRISYYYSQCEVAQDWASSGGQRTYRYGCLTTGQNWSNDGSTDTIIGVCIDVGHHGSGNVELSNGNVYITGSSFKGSGTSGNAKFDGTINGDIDALDFGLPSGNIHSGSGALGTVELGYYCTGDGGILRTMVESSQAK